MTLELRILPSTACTRVCRMLVAGFLLQHYARRQLHGELPLSLSGFTARRPIVVSGIRLRSIAPRSCAAAEKMASTRQYFWQIVLSAIKA